MLVSEGFEYTAANSEGLLLLVLFNEEFCSGLGYVVG